MKHTTTRPVGGRGIVVVLSGLLAAGCTTAPAAEKPAPSTRVAVSGMPSTFAAVADWSVAVRRGSTVAAADPGILVLQPAGAWGYAVSVLDPGTGVPRWMSVPIPITAGAPQARFTSDDGHAWVVVESTVNTATTLWVFDAYAVGRNVRPVQDHTFEGAEGKPPVVTVTDRGVLVTRVKGGAAFVYRPASGVAQVFVTPGQVPIRSYGTDVLVTLAGGFGLIAEKIGWLSKDRVPPGVASPATATVVAVDGPFVVASWIGTDQRTTLALHELLTGRVRATSRLIATDPAIHQPQTFVVARDGAWAVYGSRAFNLSTGAETALRGGPYTFTQIQDGVAYGVVEAAGRAPSASPPAFPPATKQPAVVDLLTGAALDAGTPRAVPSDFDGLGHGLLVVRAARSGDDTLFAVPLKRWVP
ncbi:hypothetical protein AB0H83_36140 [Dactylosporangium sp. NPDC050688]|uniref:hypothetical protein n=1 Tax=Dactylosporangium sp. NPDC050688 TaxID=3157217 RepID=UPI0033DC91C0